MKSCEIIYSLYQLKEIIRKAYNNIGLIRMDTIFMNSGNSKTSYPHGLVLNISDKINLKKSDKCIVLSNLGIYFT